MKTVKIGMVQSLVVFDAAKENLARSAEGVRLAASKGAQICVLPECGDLGWANDHAPELAQPVPGCISGHFSALARETGVWIAAGMTEKDGEHIHNTALLFDPTGAIRLRHRKINVLSDVEGMYTPGMSLSCIDTPFGRVGMTICADNLQESLCLGHSLGRMGVQLLLSPSAWAVPPEKRTAPYGQEWHTPYGELSRLYHMGIVGVSNVGDVPRGPWAGWSAIGHSIAYAGDGHCIAELSHGPRAEEVRVIDMPVFSPSLSGTALSAHVQKERTL